MTICIVSLQKLKAAKEDLPLPGRSMTSFRGLMSHMKEYQESDRFVKENNPFYG